MKASQVAKASNGHHIDRVVIRRSVALYVKKQTPHDALNSAFESCRLEGYRAGPREEGRSE
jgi:hypothetical protein